VSPPTIGLLVAALLLPAALLLSGCRSTVTVKTGMRVVCTNGEVVSEDVRQIEVPAEEAGAYTVRTETVTCEAHGRQPKPSAGERIPADKDVSDTATPAAPGQEPLGPMANLRDFVRDDIPGHTARPLVSDELVLTRAYVPIGRTTHDRLVIRVERYRDSVAARERIETFVKAGHASEGVDFASGEAGLAGYFGIDGEDAILALDNAGVLLTFEMHATNARAGTLRPALEDIAGIVLD
jgi:hypothetical protein